MKGCFVRFLVATILGVGLIHCSGGGDSGGGRLGGNEHKSKEEALRSLSLEQKASFEAWQNKMIKACDAAEIFGLQREKKTDQFGVDPQLLLKKNKNSAVFSDGKDFLILTGFHLFSGTSTTKVEERFSLNGKTSLITAETKREGSTCSVYLYGNKILETPFVESFTVGVHYSPERQVSVASPIPVIKKMGKGNFAEVEQHGIYSLLNQVLSPSNEAHLFLSRYFELDKENVIKLFRLSPHTLAGSAAAVRGVEGDSRWPWSNAENGNLIAQSSQVRKYFEAPFLPLSIEIRLFLPQFDFVGVKNTSDEGNLKLLMAITMARKEKNYNYTVKTLQNLGLTPFQQAEAEVCIKERVEAYLGSFAEMTRKDKIFPPFYLMLSPCKRIFERIEEVSYQNGFLRSLIPTVFANITPSHSFQYSGWENVLSHFAKKAVRENKNIEKELDPSRKTVLIPRIANYLEILHVETQRTRNLELQKEQIYQMGLDWAFRGYDVSLSKVKQILQSLDNVADVFLVSSGVLLEALANRPDTQDESLSFALTIDSSYKKEATKALQLSRDLQYLSFEREVFNLAIQKRVLLEEWKNWSQFLSVIKGEIQQYPSLRVFQDTLISYSVKWLRTEKLTTEALSKVYAAFHNTIESFPDSTKQLLRDLGESFTKHKSSLEFAQNITAEHKQLTTTIKEYSKAAESEDWGQKFIQSILQKQPDLAALRAWKDFWIAASAFVTREKTRTAGESSITAEWNRKKVLDVAIGEIWSAQDFGGLESITQVAKTKESCSRHRDTSSLADCVGMGLFSKKQKKFFEPAYGSRYSSLALQFQGYLSQLSGFDWTSLRWALLGEFFGTWEPIWSQCSNAAFLQKSVKLQEYIELIRKEKDQIKKWGLEKQIKDTIQNCTR